MPFYVCSDVLFCSFLFFSLFFGESSSSVDFCFSSDWSCSPFFFSFRLPCSSLPSCSYFASSSAASSFFFFLFLFFSLLLLLLCLEEKTAMVAFFLAAMLCVGFSFFFGSSVENGPTTTKRQKLHTIFLALFHPRHFSNKTFCPSCLGFSFGRFAS